MFQKIHLRLAVFCGSVTVFILLAMSFASLYISEQNLKSSAFISFQNDMNTLLGNVEQQTVITHEWLAKMEDHGKYQIRITDNGVPFLYNERESEDQKQLFEKALAYYETHYKLSAPSERAMSHVEFSFSPDNNNSRYYVCAALSERNSASFQVLILSSLQPLYAQINRQRFLFAALDILGAAALTLFAWRFTKKILRPLRENQEKQIQFIASASHELRTPLAVMLSCASACEKASGAERERFLSSIQEEGLRMSGLIDDMLLLTTADTHSWTIQTQIVEPDTLLLNVFEAFQQAAAQKHLRLSIRLPETAVAPLSCDKERIRQVLVILVQNALSYTPENGSICLSLTQNEKNTVFSVADNGVGIPENEKEHIFERFYRAEKSRSQKGHFGLGLCIASEIVGAHRGRIAVSDTPGGGSTFTVTL